MSGITASVYEDTTLPAPGEGFTYLVQGYSDTCGLGTLGLDSTETNRSNSNPAACSDSAGTEAAHSSDQETGGRLDDTVPRRSIR